MSETWLKSCIKVPYPNPLSRLDQYSSSVPNGGNPYGNSMQFIVNHVVAGMFSSGNQPHNVMSARGNSWPITLFRSGRAEQHFPLEAMCWHAGAKANYRGIGIEWEGGTNHSGPTAAQKAKGIEVETEIARFRGWASVKKGSTGYEHNYFMSTGCPGFPIPWSALEAGTKVQAPTPTVWDDIKQVSGEVTLYQDTNLVKLPSMVFVKKLTKGTKLLIKGLWKGTHYLTVYSYDRKIANGFAKSATIAPAPPSPPPPAPTFWDDVKQINQSVTLYEDTNLVALPGKTTVIKKLTKGTKLAVKGLWKNTHYITVYSYDKKIQNGFAVSATIEPAPTPSPIDPCAELKEQVKTLNNQVVTLQTQLVLRDRLIANIKKALQDLLSSL